MGGEERKGKGSHRVVKFRGRVLSFPGGVLKVGLLKNQIKVAGITDEEFIRNL